MRVCAGLLERLFQNLYDNELVYEEAFHTWASEAQQDSFGKAQALAQLSNWFNWLAEAQKDEDDADGEEEEAH
jgi:hypothetical protein